MRRSRSSRSALGAGAAAPRPPWQNMVAPFGGITAAPALAAVLRDERRLGEPVALTVNFRAAPGEGRFKGET